MLGSIPHFRVVVAFCTLAVLGYLGFSIYVVGYSGDAALRGDVVGTWKSFAVASFSFWVGSSLSGKLTSNPSPIPQPDHEGTTPVVAAPALVVPQDNPDVNI